MRNNGEAMRKRLRSTKRPSEHSERLERLVMCICDTEQIALENRSPVKPGRLDRVLAEYRLKNGKLFLQ